MAKKCLMIQMPNKKRFLTEIKNRKKIMEFIKKFNCEISTVNIIQGNILSVDALAIAIAEQKTSKIILQ